MKEVAVTIVKQDHCGMLTGEYNMDFIETEEDYIIINGISFNIIEIFSDDSGEKISNLERMFHKKYESAGFSGFDGATEWLKFSPELLEEFRCLLR